MNIFKSIRDWWCAPQPSTLLIYMKSGNVVKVDNVTEWKYEKNRLGCSLTWTQDRYAFNRLVDFDMDQVEAIVENGGNRKG